MGRPLLTPLDRLLEVADAGLRASFARPESRRPTPGPAVSGTLDETRRRHVAGLMRVITRVKSRPRGSITGSR